MRSDFAVLNIVSNHQRTCMAWRGGMPHAQSVIMYSSDDRMEMKYTLRTPISERSILRFETAWSVFQKTDGKIRKVHGKTTNLYAKQLFTFNKKLCL